MDPSVHLLHEPDPPTGESPAVGFLLQSPLLAMLQLSVKLKSPTSRLVKLPNEQDWSVPEELEGRVWCCGHSAIKAIQWHEVRTVGDTAGSPTWLQCHPRGQGTELGGFRKPHKR